MHAGKGLTLSIAPTGRLGFIISGWGFGVRAGPGHTPNTNETSLNPNISVFCCLSSTGVIVARPQNEVVVCVAEEALPLTDVRMFIDIFDHFSFVCVLTWRCNPCSHTVDALNWACLRDVIVVYPEMLSGFLRERRRKGLTHVERRCAFLSFFLIFSPSVLLFFACLVRH